jgi:hypothetical protein
MLIAENKGKLSVVDESRFSFFLEKLSIKKVQVAHPQYTGRAETGSNTVHLPSG